MMSSEVRWGIVVGAAGAGWLFLSYLVGMRSGGIVSLQLAGMIGYVVTFAAFVFSLGSLKKKQPEMTFAEGVKSGALIAGIAAVITVLANLAYHFYVDPDYANRIAELARPFYEQQGASGDDLENMLERTRTDFGWKRSVLQAGIGAILSGMLFTVLIVAVLQKMGRTGGRT